MEVSELAKRLSKFDEDDFRALDEALHKFADHKKGSGMPDYSDSWVAYTPVLSLALLKSQATLEKLTRWLRFLSCVLGILAIVQIVLMVLGLTRAVF